MELTPKQIVRELDRYIIGQDEAKRAVAVALRNRYRRAQLPQEIRDEIVPKNILMVGPTGVGKTEIARRLAKLVDAPFVKVEATKFTEVGYVGRDVESIIRDLVVASVRICKEMAGKKVKTRATVLAEERIIDIMLHPNRKPVNPIDVLLGNKPKQPELPEGERQRLATRAEELREQLRRGELEEVEIEVEVEDRAQDFAIDTLMIEFIKSGKLGVLSADKVETDGNVQGGGSVEIGRVKELVILTLDTDIKISSSATFRCRAAP